MDLQTRLSRLSPERRRALQQLLLRRTGSPSQGEATRANGDRETDVRAQGPTCRTREFYEAVSQHLDATDIGRFARFLNYGYVADQSPQHAVVDLPEHLLNATSVKLVLELVGDSDLQGRDVLDVGCGRGGLVDTLATYFAPRRIVGMDLCWSAIASAARSVSAQAAFLQGDAQQLPFADNSFDVVTNLESSHTYPSVADFYSEVARVVRPGGFFHYSDAIPVVDVTTRLALLRERGFTLQVDRDVTANVLLACDVAADRRMASFRRPLPEQSVPDFVAAPGSSTYEALRQREWIYVIYRLVRGA